MTRMYTTDIAADKADFVRDIVAAHRSEIWNPNAAAVTLALDEPAVRALELLDEESDGHVDSEGRLWIGGSEYVLEVVENCDDLKDVAEAEHTYDSTIVIKHSGEDRDLFITSDHKTLPAVIECEATEEWEPGRYDALLADAGWTRVSGWDRTSVSVPIAAATVTPAQ